MILDRIKNLFRRGGDKLANIGTEYVKSIWELDGVPAFRQFWTYGIFPWKWVYRGYYNAWHLVLDPVISDPQRERKLFRLNTAKLLCFTLSKYVWGEQCEISVSQAGNEGEEDKLQDFINSVLTANDFYTKLGELYEQGAALGGGCLKCWCEIEKDKDGNDTENKEIKLSYHMADQFVPTAWDNASVKGGIFISREAKDGYYYTRLEKHSWDGNKYVITNDVYRERTTEADRIAAVEGIEPQNILGWYYPLNEIYPLLSPYTVVEGIKESLFSYFRPAGANNLDDNSPLGMSIYGNAMDTLRAIDIAYDGFVREVQLSKKRIIVPARAIDKVADSEGHMRRFFNPEDSVYEALNFDNVDDLKIHDNSANMRVDEYVSAINALLSILCVQVGFDANIIAFDKAQGLRTATEVVSQNSKTYATVQAHQNILKSAIERLIHNIVDVAAGYDMDYEGTPVSSLIAGGYDVNIHFDDSIIQDRQTDISEGVMLTTNGLMSKKRFMVETLGMTEEDAEAELVAIKEEGKIDVEALDRFNAFSSEE